MVLRVINIVDSVLPINAGVWKAAVSTSNALLAQGIQSELWFPAADNDPQIPVDIRLRKIKSKHIAQLKTMLNDGDYDPKTCVVVTHGCWQFATRWGYQMQQMGFLWVYCPQGMLEPWSLRQKRLKKQVYFRLVEKRFAKRATVIRSVSGPEMLNLNRQFPASEIVCIPNAVTVQAYRHEEDPGPVVFSFMARLHPKKGIDLLLKAWLKSALANSPRFQLLIAGPDEGELMHVLEAEKQCSNLRYLGVVTGRSKEDLLERSAFYILPSFSEGFPTSVLEAMERGAIPMITAGCNFPEVFERMLGYEILPATDSIKEVLESTVAKYDQAIMRDLARRNHDFIESNFNIEIIASQQASLYHRILANEG